MRVLFREFAAAGLRRQDEENGRITLAWQVVRIYGKTLKDKRLPKLSSLLIGESSSKGRKQSAEDMKAALSLIRSQARGGMYKRG